MNSSELLIYQAPDGQIKIDVRLEDETVWLTQAHMAALFQVKPQNITMHLKNIYAEGELSNEATCKEFLQVQNEGSRISHKLALEKSTQEYDKYKERQKRIQHTESLNELEQDLKTLVATATSGVTNE